MPIPDRHVVNGASLVDVPEGAETAMFDMGCFWGAERALWLTEGVLSTAAGYSDAYTKTPTYEEVCSERTGHNEVVWVVYDPKVVSYTALLSVFWETHNPTQGMRQGNDVGRQYRSLIAYCSAKQLEQAEASRDLYQKTLEQGGFGNITTAIDPAAEFYLAEDYHQQYLAKNPGGYCGLGGTGLECSVG